MFWAPCPSYGYLPTREATVAMYLCDGLNKKRLKPLKLQPVLRPYICTLTVKTVSVQEIISLIRESWTGNNTHIPARYFQILFFVSPRVLTKATLLIVSQDGAHMPRSAVNLNVRTSICIRCQTSRLSAKPYKIPLNTYKI